MEHFEIERKWLPERLPAGLSAYPHTEIVQGYLCVDPVVRVRKDGGEYWLTYKGKGLLVREEYNLPLTETSFLQLLKKAEGSLIRKKRYRVPVEALRQEAVRADGADAGFAGCGEVPDAGLTAEIDVFGGAHEGLCLIEVEFPDRETAEGFFAPACFGRDVTHDKKYTNSVLSGAYEAIFGLDMKNKL